VGKPNEEAMVMHRSEMDMYMIIGMRLPLFIAGKNAIVEITTSENRHDTTE